MERNTINDLFTKIKQETKEYKPLTVEWDLTYRCPLSCVHCYQKNNRHIPELKKDIIFNTIDKLDKLGTFEYKISGGDPLIRSDIFEILKYISEKKVIVVLLTSGYYLNDEVCEKLAELHISRVETTLLGLDEETHDTLANRPGSFNRICNGVKKLTELGIPVRLKYIQMQQNFEQINRVDEMSKELGTTIDTAPYLWCHQNAQESEIEPYRLTQKEQLEYFKVLPHTPTKKTFINCVAGKYRLALTADGNVMPCGAYTRKYTAGNICEKSIEDIWYNSNLLKGFRTKIRYPVSKCRICKASEFCILCPAISSWANKNVNEPYEPMCQFAFSAMKAYGGE